MNNWQRQQQAVTHFCSEGFVTDNNKLKHYWHILHSSNFFQNVSEEIIPKKLNEANIELQKLPAEIFPLQRVLSKLHPRSSHKIGRLLNLLKKLFTCIFLLKRTCISVFCGINTTPLAVLMLICGHAQNFVTEVYLY